MEQLKHIAGRIVVPIEDAVDPEVLGAYIRAEILPFGVLGIRGRFKWIWSNVAKAARHSHTIRLDQSVIVVVVGVRVIFDRIPFSCGGIIKIRIREKPKPHDAGSPTVERGNRDLLSLDGSSPRADPDAGIFRLIFEGIRAAGTVWISLVEPKTPAVRIGSVGWFEAGFVYQAQIRPAVLPACGQRFASVDAGIGRESFQEIEGPCAAHRDNVPEAVVSPGPDDPGISAPHLGGAECDSAVHVVKVVMARRVQTGGRESIYSPIHLQGFVQHGSGLRLLCPHPAASRSKSPIDAHKPDVNVRCILCPPRSGPHKSTTAAGNPLRLTCFCAIVYR